MMDVTEFLTPMIYDLIPTFICFIAIVVLCWILPMIASAIDLQTGIKASKRLGVTTTTSRGIRKTFKKIRENMQYQMMIFILDIFLLILSVKFPLFEIPLCSIIFAILVVLNEIKSMRENKIKSSLEGQTSSDYIFKMVEIIKVMGDSKAKAVIEALNVEENKEKKK